MSQSLEQLTDAVTRIEDRADATIALVNGLAQQIRDLKDDPAALVALADRLDAQASELNDAIVANTPADPEEPVE